MNLLSTPDSRATRTELDDYTTNALVAELFQLARQGRPAWELAAAGIAAYLAPNDANMLATRVLEIHRINEENAAHGRQLIAAGIAEYYDAPGLSPIIVNAAPFPDRPSIWTKPLDRADVDDLLDKLELSIETRTREGAGA